MTKRSSRDEQLLRDMTGRDRLVANVLGNWGTQMVFIVAGFILPRMIDRRLGQELLGVWDFSWSFVSYFRFVGLGVASSVNRYVARYRAIADSLCVNRIVSSACSTMAISGALALACTIAGALLVPYAFGSRLGENAREAQWVVCFLGTSIAVEIAFGAYNGVLTGCHRWGLANVINGGWHGTTIVAMLVALFLSARLSAVSLLYLLGVVLECGTKVFFAYRVCEGLRVHPSYVTWRTIKELLGFSAKTLMPSVANILLSQTTSILIVAYLGPASLAMYSRPRSLIYTIKMLVSKMAVTLTPTASSLQKVGNTAEIRALTIRSARYSLYLSLPAVIMLVVFGEQVIQLWMGNRYGGASLPAILAIGHLAVLVHMPALCILSGLNAHGRAGAARLVASLCSVGLNMLVLGYFKWGLVGSAIAVTLPLTIVNVVDIPLLLCRLVGLRPREYFFLVANGPVLSNLPFAASLVVAKLVFRDSPFTALLSGSAVGGGVLSVLYWRSVLPDRIKTRVLGFRPQMARRLS